MKSIHLNHMVWKLLCGAWCSLFLSVWAMAYSPADSSLPATAAPHHYYGWLQIGAGVSSENYVAARIGLMGCMDEHLMMLRASGGGEISIFSTPANEFEEYGLLYGRRYIHDLFAAHIAAGPGYTVITQNHYVYYKPALLLEASASLNLRYVGVALTGYVDLNAQQPYAGIVVELQLGLIR